MTRKVIFALIFLAIGFAIGFWTGANNALAPLVTVEKVQDDDSDSDQDDYGFDENQTNSLAVTSKSAKTTVKNNNKTTKAETKSVASDKKTEKIVKTNTTSIESHKLTDEKHKPETNLKKSESEQKDTEIRTFDPNALTVVSFIQDWLDYEATLSLKNNTDRTISSFKATIIYKDMQGNILDYQEINQYISIAPQMAKSFKIKAYGHDNSYAYYKSKKSSSNPERVFTIEFKLNSYE
ncbi:MAG: hypothetical protein J6M30_09955 [Bacteroidales bacterium]|nr:hypothetical protein [Bacteroidales bacterium]MBP3254812.1 hypothetical protein [Bacteroidales bacterium]